MTHGEVGFDPAKSVEFIRETLQTLELPRDKMHMKAARPKCVWQGPPAGIVKINSDGGFQVDQGLASTGVVARDGAGFCGARCKIYEGIVDPLTIEALALRDGCVLAVDKGFTRLIFEVDSEELVKSWNERLTDRSVIRSILDDVSELSKNFLSFRICFVRREANAVHIIAKFGCLQGESVPGMLNLQTF